MRTRAATRHATAFGLNLSGGWSSFVVRILGRCEREPRRLGNGSVPAGDASSAERMPSVMIDAPPGTAVRDRYEWTGKPDRIDCRYAMQVLRCPRREEAVPADVASRIESCAKRGTPPGPRRFAPRTVGILIPGASQVVQRVVCVGRMAADAPAARELVVDESRPRRSSRTVSRAAVVDAAGHTADDGEWVRGQQPLDYDASDNAGLCSGRRRSSEPKNVGTHDRPCRRRTRTASTFAVLVPCTNGGGR